jgi:glycerophosphoinositol inositolphosphodiesterase
MSFLEKLQTKKGKKWLIVYFIFSINFIIIDLILLMLNESWGDLNIIVSDYLGSAVNIVLIIVLVILIPIIYGVVLFIIYLRKILKSNEINPHKLHKIIPFVLMFLFDAAFLLLIIFYEQYSKVIFQIFDYYSIITTPVICIVLILLLKPLFKIAPKLKNHLSNKRLNPNIKVKTIFISITVLYGLTFVSPFLFMPANVVYGDLPPKPGIIGHRGASHIAPENTLIAVERAVENGAVGIEIDIRYSKDGELILLHDDTLTRTTDVADKYPNRKKNNVDTFNFSELSSLDAGSWFVDNDPWGVIASGIITNAQAQQYRGIKIPTYLEVINYSRDHNLIVDLDTKFSSNFYFEKMINETIISGIDLKNVIVSTDKTDWIDIIKNRSATDIQLGIDMGENPSLERFQGYEENYTIAMVGDDFTNDLYRKFYSMNIPVFTGIIDSPERFYQLWCLGVWYVMSNEVHTFNLIENPIYLKFEIYLLLWIFIYIGAISTIILIKIKTQRKEI